MSRDEAIKTLLDEESIEQRLSRIEQQNARIEKTLELITSVIVVQQKDVCNAVGISSNALRAKVLNGEIDPLQADGSRTNFFILKPVENLKIRKQRRK